MNSALYRENKGKKIIKTMLTQSFSLVFRIQGEFEELTVFSQQRRVKTFLMKSRVACPITQYNIIIWESFSQFAYCTNYLNEDDIKTLADQFKLISNNKSCLAAHVIGIINCFSLVVKDEVTFAISISKK